MEKINTMNKIPNDWPNDISLKFDMVGMVRFHTPFRHHASMTIKTNFKVKEISNQPI